jgi:diguanylate cyclase (GGDEF)-like protein/PAS domain S-box-containing protein
MNTRPRKNVLSRFSLRTTLPLGLMVFWLALLGLSIGISLWQHTRQVLQQADEDLMTETAHLMRMAERGLVSAPHLVEADVTHTGADPRVTLVAVLDADAKVIFANHLAWKGKPATEVIPGFSRARFDRSVGSRLPHLNASADPLRPLAMMSFTPPSTGQVVRNMKLGVVLIEYDLHDAIYQARLQVLQARAPELLAALLLTLLLLRLLQRHVSQPLTALEIASHRLAEGDYEHNPAPVSGPREVAELSGSFNRMRAHLHTAIANLQASEEQLSVTLQSIGDALIATDLAGQISLMNPVAERLTGWSLADARGRRIEEVFQIENAETGLAAEIPIDRVLTEGLVVGLANHTVLISRGGQRYHIADSAAPIKDADGHLNGVVMVFHTVDEEYRLNQALAESELHFRTLADAGQALVWTSGLDGNCDYFNQVWYDFTGRTPEQEAGAGWAQGVHPEDLQQCMETYMQAFNARQAFSMVYRLRRYDGEYRWLLDEGKPRYDTQSRFLGFIGHCLDITDQRQAEAEIRHLANFDALTGLPNRRLLMDRLSQGLASARRSEQVGALLFIDLDQFKRVNDARGHDIGDAVLKQVSDRLSRFLREEDTVARLGGDEFVVLLMNLANSPDAAARLAMGVAEKIRGVMETPFKVDGGEYHIGASIGITVFPKAGESEDDLLREADTAMYRAKDAGRNAVVYFEAAMQDSVRARLALEQDLHHAIADNELRLYLQPQVDCNGFLIGAETLVRWQHPTRGLISPVAFVPVAEESGQIIALGRWVMAEAARMLKEFDDLGRPLRLAVNVSPREFRQPSFVTQVIDILREAGADPTHLVLEVTEGLVIEDIHDTIAKMEELNKLGIHFSIDDFGTGYSSLAYLKRMPLHELKIDRTFVQDAPHDPNDAALVETILSVAHHLNLAVVAEGVETEAQFAFLKDRKCVSFQGYLFDRPLPWDEFKARWRQGISTA